MKIVLQGERPVSWNAMYAGWHWTKRKAEADRVHELVWATLFNDMTVDMFKERVDIHITAYFKNRPLDSDNIAGKMYVDSLIGYVIEDDTREFVRIVSSQSEIDTDNPRVEIEIVEAR